MIKSAKVFLLRHGIAVEPGTSGYGEDSQRPLTREGISEMQQIAQGMKALGLEFGLILSSPYVRARQTAEIVAERLGLQKKLKFSEALKSECHPRQVLEELKKKYAGTEKILLAGHEPHLSRLVSILISGKEECSIEFKKGALCKLKVRSLEPAAGDAALQWMLTPKQLMILGNQ